MWLHSCCGCTDLEVKSARTPTLRCHRPISIVANEDHTLLLSYMSSIVRFSRQPWDRVRQITLEDIRPCCETLLLFHWRIRAIVSAPPDRQFWAVPDDQSVSKNQPWFMASVKNHSTNKLRANWLHCKFSRCLASLGETHTTKRVHVDFQAVEHPSTYHSQTAHFLKEPHEITTTTQ